MSCLYKTTCGSNFRLPSTVAFLVFHKNGITESCSSFEDLTAYKKISWSHVNWCKFCIHLRGYNICHFGMVEAMGLRSVVLRSLQWYDLPTEFHKDLLIGSKVIMGRHTDGQRELWSHNLTFLFKENRLKTYSSNNLISQSNFVFWTLFWQTGSITSITAVKGVGGQTAPGQPCTKRDFTSYTTSTSHSNQCCIVSYCQHGKQTTNKSYPKITKDRVVHLKIMPSVPSVFLAGQFSVCSKSQNNTKIPPFTSFPNNAYLGMGLLLKSATCRDRRFLIFSGMSVMSVTENCI
jgi:hypothetical protein